jgi:hypothetical protein
MLGTCPGVVNGAAEAGELTAPTPLTLIANTRNAYVVPLDKPVAVYAVVVEAVLAIKVDHVVPPFELTSTK